MEAKSTQGLVALVALVALTALVAVAEAADVEVFDARPDFFPNPGCRRDEKTVGSCIRHQFQTLLPELRKQGWRIKLPSVDPYFIPEINVDFNTAFVKFHTVLSNMTVIGLTKAIVRDARADLKDDSMSMDIDMLFPKLTFRGQFEFQNGLFATWNFKGAGPYEITFYDINATWKVHGKKHRGGKYMSVLRLNPVYTVGGMKLWAKDLVEGQPALDAIILDMVNRLWADVVEVGKPFLQEPLSHHLTRLSDDVFQSVPYDLLFPKE